MKENELSSLSDEALIAEHKKMKSANTAHAFLIGLLVGIAIYSVIRNGVGFFTFFPLFFALMLASNRKKIKPVEEELKSRNLK
ncbi:MAG: hypothetical protein EOP53_06425 [Sphingobacteriales bacterium]|nr:MAG: hypothetical protein EOP53_06425 [Sphingobacteriales bacterium]